MAKRWLTATLLVGGLFLFPVFPRVGGIAQATAQTQSHKKVALVIGNADYQALGRLKNPVNDAKSMSASLQRLGFEVMLQENIRDVAQFLKVTEQFSQRITPGSVALIYYAGHGVQVQGNNYLIPTGVKIQSEREIPYQGLNLDDLISTLHEGKSSMNILILDACRDNPFVQTSRNLQRGLAIVKNQPDNFLVAYATAPGKTASDGEGTNGLYTQELIKAMETPGLGINDVFMQVRRHVRQRSGGAQIPEERSVLEEPFYFRPPVQATPVPVLATPSPTPAPVLATPRPQPSQRPVSLPTPVPQTSSGSQPVQSQTLFNSLGMEFKRIPAGSFMMGSPSGEAGREIDESQYHVTLTEAYYMQTTEVTQAQWQAVMGNNPSHFEGGNLPVETVSWEDVQVFISQLNARGEGTYRLPTEAEWEYAARAGSSGAYSFGNDAKELHRYGNFADKSVVGLDDAIDGWRDRSVDDGHLTTALVASYRPNAWGLYDMHGNVWEWVQDWYGDYPRGSISNPRGAWVGSSRVIRGGGLGNSAPIARVANRGRNAPSDRNPILGFRLVRLP